MSIKPILFNTEMVRAILDGRKSCTRRLIKPQPDEKHTYPLGFVNDSTERKDIGSFGFGTSELGGSIQYTKPPYQPGDILYVRETWCLRFDGEKYFYKADKNTSREEKHLLDYDDARWHPSIHMPEEAARIWLKVTDVRVERLQDITEEQACMEGTNPWDEACYENNGWRPTFSDPDSGGEPNMVDGFHKLWNSTIKKSDIDRYGWNANPYVFVIEFKRCDKPESEG